MQLDGEDMDNETHCLNIKEEAYNLFQNAEDIATRHLVIRTNFYVPQYYKIN